MDISIIILTCNRPSRCIDSVWHNTLAVQGMQAETIVLNNGSMPVTLPSRIAGTPCRIMQMPHNIGAAARNEGIQAATGEFILVLDDDAYIDPGLAAQIPLIFRQNPAWGACAFRIRNPQEEEGCLLPTVFHGCACAFRKSAINQAGGYPADTLYYGEEYDVAFQLYAAGFRIGLANGPHLVRHDRDPNGRNPAHIIKLLIRNNTRFVWKYFPTSCLAPAFHDILQRYRLVAIKEKVPEAFRQGLSAVPAAIMRGTLCRRTLPKNIFADAMLLNTIEQDCAAIRHSGGNTAIICGVGKFPSLRLAALRRRGIQTQAFLDTNACWRNQQIDGVPVVAACSEIQAQLQTGAACLTGGAAFPENEYWRNLLILEHGYQPVGDAALSSAPGMIDLFNFCRMTVFLPPKRLVSASNRRGMQNATKSTRNVQLTMAGDK